MRWRDWVSLHFNPRAVFVGAFVVDEAVCVCPLAFLVVRISRGPERDL